jgi:hypothetical protein
MTTLNCITINTDASFCPRTYAGGFAFQIICDSFRIRRSGIMKVRPISPTQAEIMCIANAMFQLMVLKNAPIAKLIVINTDCKFAIHQITNGGFCKVGKRAATYLYELKRNALAHGIEAKIEFRYVAAHTGVQDARSIINEWCDSEAKRHMYEKRRRIDQGVTHRRNNKKKGG